MSYTLTTTLVLGGEVKTSLQSYQTKISYKVNIYIRYVYKKNSDTKPHYPVLLHFYSIFRSLY